MKPLYPKLDPEVFRKAAARINCFRAAYCCKSIHKTVGGDWLKYLIFFAKIHKDRNDRVFGPWIKTFGNYYHPDGERAEPRIKRVTALLETAIALENYYADGRNV